MNKSLTLKVFKTAILILAMLALDNYLFAENGDFDSLLIDYRFDNDPCGTVIDLSGNNHTGTIFGNVEYFSSLNDRQGILRFDGNSYVEISNIHGLDFEGDMSIEMWVRLNKEPESRSAFIFGDWPIGDWGLMLSHWHTIQIFQKDGYATNVLPVTRSLIDKEWAHVAVVVEYPRCFFYRNGRLIHDQYMVVPGVPDKTQSTKYLAGNNQNNGIPIDLDSFIFYRRALTPEEIYAHANDDQLKILKKEKIDFETNWYNDTVTIRVTGKKHNYDGYSCDFDFFKNTSPQTQDFIEMFPQSGRYVSEAKIKISDLKKKMLHVKAKIKNPKGDLVNELNKTLEITKPDWVQNNHGYSTEVPFPWDPVNSTVNNSDINVDVWGRSYKFAKTPFLSSIKTKNTQILAKPIEIKMAAQGKEYNCVDFTSKIRNKTKRAIEIDQKSIFDLGNLNISALLEFDGYIIFDMIFEPEEEIVLDNLIIDIPLKTEYVKLCYGDRVLPPQKGIPISEWFSGGIENDLNFHFGPTIFLGNHKLGLLWQSESDQYWHNADAEYQIEVLPRSEITYFRHNLIDAPLRVIPGEPLKYRFALQALPIKPLNQDAWDLRIIRYEPWGKALDLPDRIINGQPAIDYLREKGVRRILTRQADLWPWPMPGDQEYQKNLSELTEALHQGGLKLHPYVFHQRFPVLVDHFDPYGTNIANFPVRQYTQASSGDPQRPGPVKWGPDARPQGTIFMCTKSMALQDAYISSLVQRIQTFDENGIYLDGTVHAPPCENRNHDCGFYDKDGKLHKTFPVFAVRRFMQRIYEVVKAEGVDQIIDNHCSFGYNPSALAYGDTLWTGEQWWHLRHKGADYIAGELTHDKFLTEFTGWQVGVAAELLSYRLGARSKVAAISLLYDVPVRPTLRADQDDEKYWDLITKVWALRDEFQARDAEKLYFFENSDYVQSTVEKVYVTVLYHAQNGVLALISNLDRKAHNASVTFDLDAFDLSGTNLTAFNGLTRKKMNLENNNTINVFLESHEWTYVWIKPLK